MDLAPYLEKLVRDPSSLTVEDIDTAFVKILNGNVPDVQVAAFLCGARVAHRDLDYDFIAAVVHRFQKEARKFHVDSTFVDIVGTGGDKQNTFNVSSTAAIVASGIPGIRVAKHGGPSSTSKSGASDLFSALGADVSKVNEMTAPYILSNSPFSYLSAPVFHPIMASVRRFRKELGIPSVLNLVGPLLNPAPLEARVVGVYLKELGPVFAKAIQELQKNTVMPNAEAFVVWGAEGLDEVSIAGPTHIWHLTKSGDINHFEVTPEVYGLQRHPLDDVRSGTPEENASIARSLLENRLPEGHPILDYVLINTATLAVVDGKAANWKEGVALARESISSGQAKKSWSTFVAHCPL